MSLHAYHYEQLNSRLCPSVLNCGFMAELELNNAYLPQQIRDVMSQYRQVVHNQLHQEFYGIGIFEGEAQHISDLVHQRAKKELDAVEEFAQRMWGLCQGTKITPQDTGVSMRECVGFDPECFSSPLSGIYTPASTLLSSPRIPLFGQDQQLYISPQPQVTALVKTDTSRWRIQCYKELELNQRGENHKWFADFLSKWVSEKHNSNEEDLVNFINAHQSHIESINLALSGGDDNTLDPGKYAELHRQIKTPQFFYAAVEICYEIDKRLRIGPEPRNGKDSKVGDDFDGRVLDVCRYLMSCKNSCIRLCLPTFMSEVVDQPAKMFERFSTNCKGNAAKKDRNDVKKATGVAGADGNQGLNSLTTKSARPRKLDQLIKSPIPQTNATSKGPKRRSMSGPVHRVAKRYLPRRGTPKYYGEDSKDSNNEDTDSDEFDGDSIHVASAPCSNSIDPTLLHPHSQAEMSVGDLFLSSW